MKFQKIVFLAIVALVVISCKNEVKDAPQVVTVETDTKNVDLDESERTAVTFKEENVKIAFNLYNTLRASLVNTNPQQAATHAAALYNTEIIQQSNDDTKKAVQLIMDAKDVEEQRKQFVTVTKTIEELVANNIESGSLYKQYCPMAFGNTGAYWLSDSKEIRNPYFGDKMLKCGRVDAEIK